jgi:DNA/RNA-binding domain of Phe-tRNA-synthetase-like protein
LELQGGATHGVGQRLPGVVGMLEIDGELKRQCPGLQVVCLHGSVEIAKSSPELLGLLNTRAEELRAKGGEPSDHPEIAATRAAYKALGKEPSRYRNSAEALLRRITSGKGLYFINNLVDINNLVSLESLMPVGTYDLAKVTPPLIFREGRSGESYKGIGKDVLNIADLPVFADKDGPFGSPTSDSERAMITGSTTAFAMMIISFSGKADLGAWAQRAVELLETHANGTGLTSDLV